MEDSGWTIAAVRRLAREGRAKTEETTDMEDKEILIPSGGTLGSARDLATITRMVAAELEALLEPFYEHCGGDSTWDPKTQKQVMKGLQKVAQDFLDSTPKPKPRPKRISQRVSRGVV